MLKKLNKYILTHFPLLWNTKFIPAVAIALLLNLFMLLLGVLNFSGYVELQLYTLYMNEQTLVLLSIIVSLLFFIIWLSRYARNNAFTNFYPLKKGYLVKEFLLVLAIVLLNMCYYFSFKLGYFISANAALSTKEVINFENETNLAMMFLPHVNSSYEKSSKCKLEELNSMSESNVEELSKRQFFYNDNGAVDTSLTNFILQYEDSIRKVFKLPKKAKVFINGSNFFPNRRYGDNHDIAIVETAAEAAIDDSGIKNQQLPKQIYNEEYSYYYYCQQYFNYDNIENGMVNTRDSNIYSRQKINALGAQILLKKDSLALKKLLTNFKRSLDKYNIIHYFDEQAAIKLAFRDSIWNYSREEFIGAFNEYISDAPSGDYKKNNTGYYINFSGLNNFYNNIWKLKLKFWNYLGGVLMLLGLLYFGVSIAFSILIYRLTGLRAFLVAVIYAGIISLVIALFLFLTKMVDPLNLSWSLLFFDGFIIVLGLLAVYKKFIKQWAKVLLNLAAVAAVLFWILLYGIILALSESSEVFYNDRGVENAFSIQNYSNINLLLAQNDTIFFFILLFLYFCTVWFFYIPLAKKLKGNPEE